MRKGVESAGVVLFRGFGGKFSMRHLFGRSIVRGAAILLFFANVGQAQTVQEPVRIAVDLRDLAKHIFHAKLKFPVKPGTLTLVYPQWIQGEHSPTGPIVDLTGLKMWAAGKEVTWRRDDVDMYAFHLEVPQGVETLEVSLDYLSPRSRAVLVNARQRRRKSPF